MVSVPVVIVPMFPASLPPMLMVASYSMVMPLGNSPPEVFRVVKRFSATALLESFPLHSRIPPHTVVAPL